MFENKEQLSIRQWQKVALARAFLRDYQLIVLDEPTSALDPKAEYEVFQQFRQLLNGQSAILITHRLSEGGVWGAIKAIAFRQRSSQPQCKWQIGFMS